MISEATVSSGVLDKTLLLYTDDTAFSVTARKKSVYSVKSVYRKSPSRTLRNSTSEVIVWTSEAVLVIQ
jgi:hypothetical protein